jgi:hypothetical protein
MYNIIAITQKNWKEKGEWNPWRIIKQKKMNVREY